MFKPTFIPLLLAAGTFKRIAGSLPIKIFMCR